MKLGLLLLRWSVVLVGVWITWSGVAKAVDPLGAFVGASGILGGRLARVFVPMLACVEVYFGLGVVFTRYAPRALIGAVTLFAVFTLYLIVTGMRSGWESECGCGALPTSIPIAVARNLGCIAVCAIWLRTQSAN